MIIETGKNVKVHYSVRSYGQSKVGANSIILENVCLGYPTTKILLGIAEKHLDFVHSRFKGCVIGRNAIVRSDSIIYCNVRIGDYVRTGHRVLIRENCIIGSNVLIGTNTIIEANCQIGSHISIQSSAFIPSRTVIEDYVFIGPSVSMSNDKYPVRIKKTRYDGPLIKKGASLGAGSVILPGLVVGEGAFVAANAVVTEDVPKWHLAVGVPARIFPLEKKMRKMNDII